MSESSKNKHKIQKDYRLQYIAEPVALDYDAAEPLPEFIVIDTLNKYVFTLIKLRQKIKQLEYDHILDTISYIVYFLGCYNKIKE